MRTHYETTKLLPIHSSTPDNVIWQVKNLPDCLVFQGLLLSSCPKCNHGKNCPTYRILIKLSSLSKKNVHYSAFLIFLRIMTLLVNVFSVLNSQQTTQPSRISLGIDIHLLWYRFEVVFFLYFWKIMIFVKDYQSDLFVVMTWHVICLGFIWKSGMVFNPF